MSRYLCIILSLTLCVASLPAQMPGWGNMNNASTYSTPIVYNQNYNQQHQGSQYYYQPTTQFWPKQPVLYNQQSQAWNQNFAPSSMLNYGPNYALSGYQEYQTFQHYPTQHTHPAYRLEELRMRQNQQRWMYQQQLTQSTTRDDRQWMYYMDQQNRFDRDRRNQARYQKNVAVATMFGSMMPMMVMATQPTY